MNMSPVKARAEGKPILLDVKNSIDGGRFSTGCVRLLFSTLLNPHFVAGVTNSFLPNRNFSVVPYTSGRPVLPDDLASEIQQFMQSEFARQYFSTHKTGFIFRKKIPVEKMMAWQKVRSPSHLKFVYSD